jgi:hypothetical protein
MTVGVPVGAGTVAGVLFAATYGDIGARLRSGACYQGSCHRKMGVVAGAIARAIAGAVSDARDGVGTTTGGAVALAPGRSDRV